MLGGWIRREKIVIFVCFIDNGTQEERRFEFGEKEDERNASEQMSQHRTNKSLSQIQQNTLIPLPTPIRILAPSL